ncbi:SAM-dependent methyltransferase [Streptomyces sp. NBC_01433]|uniref:SAM-dependent methyltransferase n=1 Tax=Streptomyces sp. NBC_01433 TaxID=2903864 RepID=UPI002251F126|nr:SAM-dependent methyltransferase [Streptomyces sp. NBC_01433]MCX4677633.1 SAM-dependent methyltransferase [Streptomyces sp. NBC_01433]
MSCKDSPPRPEDWTTRPAVSRIDNYLLGGSENYPPDRELALQLLDAAPWLPQMVRINGSHRPRVVHTLARDLDISQFVDLGCGLPPRWKGQRKGYDPGAPVYDAARLAHNAPRVVYVDNDQTVCAHARTTLDEHPTTTAVYGDIREIANLLDHPKIASLDRGRPIAMLLHDLLPWVPDAAAHQVMAELREWLPTGSAISLTHATTDWVPEVMKDLVALYAEVGISYQPRSLDEISALLAPWEVLPPGIVPTGQWRGASGPGDAVWEHPNAYAAVVTRDGQDTDELAADDASSLGDRVPAA